MCKPTKISKFHKIRECHYRAITEGEKQITISHFLNTMTPVLPAIVDELPDAIKLFKDIFTVVIGGL
jgi:hypothetical protein